MNNNRILIDLDGVVASLSTTIWDLLDPKQQVAKGIDRTIFPSEFDKNISLDTVWGTVGKAGLDFYGNIPMFWWSKELVETCQSFGEVAFLTSPGDVTRYPEQAAKAAYGKHIWVNRYFNDVPLIVTRNKYLCSAPQTILVDDTELMIKNFVSKGKGGVGFHWPSASTITNSEIFKQTMESLSTAINSLH